MKIHINKRLFWFLKDNATLDLEETSMLDMYVQQVLTRGCYKDVKELLKTVSFSRFRASFERIKQFLPFEIRNFWKDYFGNLKQASKRGA